MYSKETHIIKHKTEYYYLIKEKGKGKGKFKINKDDWRKN